MTIKIVWTNKYRVGEIVSFQAGGQQVYGLIVGVQPASASSWYPSEQEHELTTAEAELSINCDYVLLIGTAKAGDTPSNITTQVVVPESNVEPFYKPPVPNFPIVYTCKPEYAIGDIVRFTEDHFDQNGDEYTAEVQGLVVAYKVYPDGYIEYVIDPDDGFGRRYLGASQIERIE